MLVESSALFHKMVLYSRLMSNRIKVCILVVGDDENEVWLFGRDCSSNKLRGGAKKPRYAKSTAHGINSLFPLSVEVEGNIES